MTLKRFFYKTALLVVLSLSIASCTSEHEEPNYETYPYVDVTYNLDVNDDLLKAYDLVVYYNTKSNSDPIFETITGSFSKTIEFRSFPSTFSLIYHLVPRKDADPDAEYKIKLYFNNKTECVYENGEHKVGQSIYSKEYTVTGKTLKEYADIINKYLKFETKMNLQDGVVVFQ